MWMQGRWNAGLVVVVLFLFFFKFSVFLFKVVAQINSLAKANLETDNIFRVTIEFNDKKLRQNI